MRFIIYTLLFIIIFLSGIIVGINKETTHVDVTEDERIEQMIEEDIEKTLYMYEEHDQPLFMQKIASFFEKIVSVTLNAIVSVMYMIAKLFTG